VVDAHLESTYRKTPGGLQETPYRAVVDENGHDLSTVSKAYTLVQSADAISVLESCADMMGLALSRQKGLYRNGRAFFAFNTPDFAFQVPGDTSTIVPNIWLRNDYRGKGSLSLSVGWLRLVCQNGLIRATVARSYAHRHVGTVDLFAFLGGALQKAMEALQVERVIAETLANTPLPKPEFELTYSSHESAQEAIDGNRNLLVAEIFRDTPTRYLAPLAENVHAYVSELGPTRWALAQAVTDVASHRMQETQRGEARRDPNLGAMTWASRQVDRVINWS
jgi:hypothetical protein